MLSLMTIIIFQVLNYSFLLISFDCFCVSFGTFRYHGNFIKNSRWRPLENHDVISTSCHFVSLFHIDDLNSDIFGNPTHPPSFISVAWLLLELTVWIALWYFHWLKTKFAKVGTSSIQANLKESHSHSCAGFRVTGAPSHWAFFSWKPFCLCFQWITGKFNNLLDN